MSELDVRIVKIEPMRVASIWGFGKEPESVAFAKLDDWAGPKGFRNNPEKHRIFGFNNPDPYPGSPNYGYEIWVEVGPDVEPEGDVRILDFAGGLYAVARCKVPLGRYEVITETWKKLVAWLEESQYSFGHNQWLEQSLPSDSPEIEFILDLHLSITE
jgi:DNA gyrase inhibitor GyrI